MQEYRAIAGFTSQLTLTFRSSTVLLAAAGVFAATAVSGQTITGGYSTGHAVSRHVTELPPAVASGPTVIHHLAAPSTDPHRPDGATQTIAGPLINATGGVNFEGMNVNNGGYIPSDNNIAVGPNHIVEVVNAAYAVYSKAGATLLTPRALGTLWSGLSGSTCSNNSGDTVVQYDRLADRWMITQLGSLSSPYSECVAVSTTNDPTTTSYNLYTYNFGTNLNDYPKWGVWPTATNPAYLATYNLFANGASFVGSEICAYDRTAMLSGAATAGFVCATGINGASYLPVDLDGPTPPVDGTPAYFMDIFGSSLGVYTMSPNFAVSPPTATLSAFSTIPVAGYSQASSSPQPGTTRVLDSLSDRAMYRLAFRTFSNHESIVLNHSVVAGSGASGVRWYELQAPISKSGTFTLFQQGTYAPDSSYRWMGSAAMDQAGDIAIGYSLSDGVSTYPSVRYSGRTPADALGTMESEGVIINGAGSQTGYARWGDYSSMRIDPSDDCTFWYVNEYYPVTSSAGWHTRIGSFKFANCTTNPDFLLSASPASATVNPGNPATSTISVAALNGYAGTVNLTVTSGCPGGGATCSLSATSVPAGGSSTLTVSTTSSTPPGSYTVTVNGADSVNASLTHTTTFTVTVVQPDFSISASPSSFSVTQGKSNSSTITLTSTGGFANSVTLSTPCLVGATCSFSVNPVTPTGSSVLTVTPSTSTPPGTYSIVVTGTTSGGPGHSVAVTVKVNADFTMPATMSMSVTRNSSSSASVSVGLVGSYTTSVTLSISGLTNGLSASFAPNPVNSGSSSTLTVTARRNVKVGTYNLTITGANGTSTHTTALTLTVN